MILADTSVWIHHLRYGDPVLTDLLNTGSILGHRSITVELALGNLKHRTEILAALANLPQAQMTNDEELLQFINQRRLFGIGIGYVDAHLLASVSLSQGARLWTRDKALRTASEQLGIAANFSH